MSKHWKDFKKHLKEHEYRHEPFKKLVRNSDYSKYDNFCHIGQEVIGQFLVSDKKPKKTRHTSQGNLQLVNFAIPTLFNPLLAISSC